MCLEKGRGQIGEEIRSACNHLLAFLFPFLVLAAACGGQEDPAPAVRAEEPMLIDASVVAAEGRQGGGLRYPMAGEPRTFNYLAASDSRSKVLAYLTTGTLLEFDASRQEVREGLAKRFELSSDGMSARLELRRGLRFSDGTPCTIEDVLFTFDAIYAKDSVNFLKDVLLIEGEPLLISRLDDHSLELKFPAPFAAAGYVLSTVPVLPRHRFNEPGRSIEEYWTLDTPPEEMSGLGPFVIQDHEHGRRTVLEYNRHYWKVDSKGTRLPYLDRIIIEYTQDRNAQLLRFKSGELDLLDQLLRPEDLGLLEQEDGIECVDAGPSSNLAFLWFNLNDGVSTSTGHPVVEPQKKAWFTDARFRRAISYAISRHAIVQNVYLGLATESFSLVPLSNRKWYSAGLREQAGNQSEAKRLLREAGFSWLRQEGRDRLVDGEGNAVEFRLISPSDEILGKIVAILLQDLESLGISVAVQQEELRAVISRVMGSKDYDAALMNLDFPVEPTDMSNVLLSTGTMHFWNPDQKQPATPWEARIDQLVREQGRTMDEASRIALFRKIQQILIEQRPFIPLVNRNVLVAWQKNLGNVNPANVFPFALWNIWELSWGLK